MSSFNLTYIRFGESSILIEWPQEISETTLKDVLNFKQKIYKKLFKEIIYINSAYNSILVNYKYFINDFKKEVEALKSIYNLKKTKDQEQQKLWKTPVCYDPSFGIDLEELSNSKNLEIQELVSLHSSSIYTVYFMGFLPGFLYLGGLTEVLHTPRKSSPRLKILKGAVAIGGNQTGIYPQESPGGWHIIGNSPIQLFDSKKKQPSFIKSGDKIKFMSVTLNKYNEIKYLVDNNVYQLESEVVND